MVIQRIAFDTLQKSSIVHTPLPRFWKKSQKFSAQSGHSIASVKLPPMPKRTALACKIDAIEYWMKK